MIICFVRSKNVVQKVTWRYVKYVAKLLVKQANQFDYHWVQGIVTQRFTRPTCNRVFEKVFYLNFCIEKRIYLKITNCFLNSFQERAFQPLNYISLIFGHFKNNFCLPFAQLILVKRFFMKLSLQLLPVLIPQ